MRQTAFTIALVMITIITNIFLGCAILSYVIGPKAHPYTLYPPYSLAALISLWWGFSKIRHDPEKVRAGLVAFCSTFFVPFAGGFVTSLLRAMSPGYSFIGEYGNVVVSILIYLAKTVPFSMAAFGLGCIFAAPLLAFNLFMFTAYRQALRGKIAHRRSSP